LSGLIGFGCGPTALFLFPRKFTRRTPFGVPYGRRGSPAKELLGQEEPIFFSFSLNFFVAFLNLSRS
jgi:hypothetical protein